MLPCTCRNRSRVTRFFYAIDSTCCKKTLEALCRLSPDLGWQHTLLARHTRCVHHKSPQQQAYIRQQQRSSHLSPLTGTRMLPVSAPCPSDPPEIVVIRNPGPDLPRELDTRSSRGFCAPINREEEEEARKGSGGLLLSGCPLAVARCPKREPE